MRILAGFLVSVILSSSLLAQSHSNEPGDESAIKDVVQKYEDARNRPDQQKIQALFTEDSDQLVSTGEWRKGRSAIVRGTMASSRSSGGRRTITMDSIRFVSPDVVIVDARYEIAGLAGGASRKMWTTFVMRRGAESWRIAAIRNMLPAPPPPSK